MKAIPPKLKADFLADPAYKTCMLYGHHGHTCEGRITFEHTLIFAGKQLQTKYAIIALCAKGHEVDNFQDAGTMVKDMNVWIALNRANDYDLMLISKAIDYKRMRDNLNTKYGPWEQRFPTPFVGPLADLVRKDVPFFTIHVNSYQLKLIQEAVDWHKANDGARFNTTSMLTEMIRQYKSSLEIVGDL